MDFSKIRNYIFLGLLSFVTIVFLYIIRPFAYPIFWAAVIAALFYPIYQKLEKHLKQRSLSTLITLMLVTVIILIPLTILGTLLVRESINLYDALNTNRGQISNFIRNLTDELRGNSYLARLHLDDGAIAQRLDEAGRAIINFVLISAKSLTQNSLEFLGLFIITIYTLFFFIRDGAQLLKRLMYLCPLGDRYETLLYRKFTSTASATIKGTLIVGTLQGILGGILFAVVGIPGALIWGIIMAALSIIPATGSFVVWFPAGIILLFMGNIWQGIVVLAVGAVLISTIDNLLRPVLVGKDLQMHPLIILFSTLGGIALFGISGFIIGPIIAALFLSFWEMYEEYYRNELAHN